MAKRQVKQLPAGEPTAADGQALAADLLATPAIQPGTVYKGEPVPGRGPTPALTPEVEQALSGGQLRRGSELEPAPSLGAVSVLDRETGELEAAPAFLRDSIYAGAAQRLTDEQALALMQPVRDDEVEIKPDSFGAVYLSHTGYRRRLNAAFGVGGWVLRPLDKPRFDEQTHLIYQHYALIGGGRFLGQAVGEQAYFGPRGDEEGSGGMTYGDALEGAKSNALIRCCKDLGVALELWDRRTANALRERIGVEVMVNRRGREVRAWRRRDDSPLRGEFAASTRPRPSQAPAPQAAPQAAAAQAGEDRPISEDQLAELNAALVQAGVTGPQLRDYIKATHGLALASRAAIPRRVYVEVLRWVEGSRA